MSKHTPGPWKIQKSSFTGARYLFSECGECLAKVIPGSDNACFANARLIAAAPKMYELLDKLRKVINETCEHGDHSSGLMNVWNTLANEGMNLLDKIDGQE